MTTTISPLATENRIQIPLHFAYQQNSLTAVLFPPINENKKRWPVATLSALQQSCIPTHLGLEKLIFGNGKAEQTLILTRSWAAKINFLSQLSGFALSSLVDY